MTPVNPPSGNFVLVVPLGVRLIRNHVEEQFQRQNIPPTKIPPLYRAKWPVGLLAEGFVPFPKTALRGIAKILEGPNAMEELVLLLAIIDFKRPSMTRDPSIEYLAFTIGVSVEEASRILTRLVEKGLVTVSQGDRGLSIGVEGLFTKIASIALADISPPNVSTDDLPDSW